MDPSKDPSVQDLNAMYNPHARHHKSNKIHETAIIYDNVQMGKNNVIGAYTIIGSDGEIRGAEESYLGSVIIGDNNIISELVTIQRPYEKTQTVIGDNNYIMVHCHISHDVTVENNCEICGGSVILGYVTIKDDVQIKVGCRIRNRVTIGKGALVGQASNVVKDVRPGYMVYGNPAREKSKIESQI